jgi:phosphoribosylformimino-5-aminoimidazole carboxamide ribotide isomerase
VNQDSDRHLGKSRGSFRVIPVLDVRGGRAVHARGGSRAGYRPVSGELGPGDDPLALAAAFRDRLGCRDVYVADLDAIGGGAIAGGLLRSIIGLGVAVVADVGLRDTARAEEVRSLGVDTVVAATETLAGPEALAEVVARLGPAAVVFGLDFRNGHPLLAAGASWPDDRPEALLARALAAGVRRVLLLDLAEVGSGRGVGTLALVRLVKQRDPSIEVLVGGGVAGLADLLAARDAGADGVLVASALHDGRIDAADLAVVMPEPAD